jgi:membrane protease YdiL (CAAX protease family)
MAELQQPAQPSTAQPERASRLSLVRAAVFALMTLYVALQVGPVIWFKLTSADQPELRRSQVSTRLAFAATQVKLVYLYRHLELDGADTRSPLLDRLGFQGRQSSQALAEAALEAYMAAVGLDRLDVNSRVSAAVLLTYLGRQQEAVQLLQKGVAAGSPQASILMTMLRFYSGEIPRQSWAASGPVRRVMERLPAGRLYLISVYSTMGDIEKVERQEQIALAISKRTGLKLAVVATFVGLLLAMGLIAWFIFLLRGLPAARFVKPAQWTARDVFETFILWLFLQALIAHVASQIAGQGMAVLVTSYVVAAALALVWLWRASLAKQGIGLSALGWRSAPAVSARPSPQQPALRAAPTKSGRSLAGHAFLKHVFTGVVGYTAALPVVAAILVGLRLWKGDLFPSHPLIPMFSQAPDWTTKAAILFLAIVAAPLVEETFFRGVLYPAMRRRLRPFNARLASAFIFAAAHLEAVGFIPLLFLGVVFAYLYDRTDSLVAPAVAHALTNAVSLVILLAL